MHKSFTRNGIVLHIICAAVQFQYDQDIIHNSILRMEANDCTCCSNISTAHYLWNWPKNQALTCSSALNNFLLSSEHDPRHCTCCTQLPAMWPMTPTPFSGHSWPPFLTPEYFLYMACVTALVCWAHTPSSPSLFIFSSDIISAGKNDFLPLPTAPYGPRSVFYTSAI